MVDTFGRFRIFVCGRNNIMATRPELWRFWRHQMMKQDLVGKGKTSGRVRNKAFACDITSILILFFLITFEV